MIKIIAEKEVQAIGQIEPNAIINGDCLEIMKYIPSGTVDLVLADPPYG